jgi:hypothetical protein
MPDHYGMKDKEVWDKPRPKDLPKPKELSSAEKRMSMRRAAKAGRPYPNLVDNMAAAREKK